MFFNSPVTVGLGSLVVTVMQLGSFVFVMP